MRFLPIIFILIMSISLGCHRNNIQLTQEELSAQEKIIPTKDDSAFVENFFKDIVGDTTADWKTFIDTEINSLDSSYYIEFTTPINGYTVKGVLNNMSEGGYNDICGNALLLLTKDSVTRYIEHPFFEIPDSIFKNLKTRQINRLEYNIESPDDFKENQLGQFANVPFAFYDIDFDGQKDLLIKFPHFAQRSRNAYFPVQEKPDDSYNYKESDFYVQLDSIYTKNMEEGSYPPFDDQTEFDSKNKDIILYISVALHGNEKHYYRVRNRKPQLIKEETYISGYDSLARIKTYTNTGSKVKYIISKDKLRGKIFD